MLSQSPIARMEFPLSMGKSDCFDLVFRTYHQPLVYYATRFVGGDDARDLVENLFVKLWQKKPELNDEKHLQNYLYQAIRNSCLDFKKVLANTMRRQYTVVQEMELTEESHLEQLIRSEVLAEVYRGINALPLQCARVITLSFIEGKSNTEIADALDLSEQTVKNHKVRGLKVLRENLSGNALLLLLFFSVTR